MKFKRVFALVLFTLLSVSGVLFGCRGKYDDMKVTSDKDEIGLQLYLDDEVLMEGQPDRSIGEVQFTISGVGSDVSKTLKYNYDNSIIEIIDEKLVGNTTTLTLKALSGGLTNFVALSEEGGASDVVLVECIREIKDLKFDSEYKPAMFNLANNEYAVQSKKIIFNNGAPEGTTQNEITYSIAENIAGVSISPSGVIRLSQKIVAPNNELTVIARSVAKPSLYDEVKVHLIEELNADDISFITASKMIKDGVLTLTTTGYENNLTFDVDVNTMEKISIGYSLDEIDDTISGAINCVNIEQNLTEFHIYSNSIGNCKFSVEVGFSEYTDAPKVSKEMIINVIQLPQILTISDGRQNYNDDFADDLYTTYQNGLGQQYTITIGDTLAYDKRFLIAVDNTDDFRVKTIDGNLVKLATREFNGKISNGYDLLPTGSSIYVTGLNPNSTANIYIYSYGTFDFTYQLYRKITISTYLGSTFIEPIYSTLDGRTTSTYYVEIGHSFELEYNIDFDSSAKNIKLVNANNTEIYENISVEYTNDMKPTIIVNGLSEGTLHCKLVLDNMVESDEFVISVFVPFNYDDENHNSGGYRLSVDSPLINKNIAEVDNPGGILNGFVMSLGTGTQLYLDTNPSNATIYSLNYETVLFVDDVETSSGSDYATISRTGYVTTKKILQPTFEEDGVTHTQRLYIKVTMTSLATNNSDKIITVKGVKYVWLEVYYPLTSVRVSTTTSTIYWYESLNVVQRQNQAYISTISVSVPQNINTERLQIIANTDLRISTISKTNFNVFATDMPENALEKSVHLITITTRYYSTTIVKKVSINVVKAIQASQINVFVDDNIDKTTAYFDITNGVENVSPIKINTLVYSSAKKQNVTFKKVYYEINQRDESIATVDENGFITPHSAGKMAVRVYAEDMISADGTPTQYKVINVIVADGLTEQTALRVRNENDFKTIKTNQEAEREYYYFLAGDIYFSEDFYLEKFGGHIQGYNHYLQNIVLSANHKALFGTIKEDASIKNLSINLSFDFDLTQSLEFAGIALKNYGIISNINLLYSKSDVNIKNNIETLKFGGVVVENYGKIYYPAISILLNIKAQNNVNVENLFVGGVVALNGNKDNRAYIYGKNDNYQYITQNFVQDYEFDGSILVSNISSVNSAIGGIVAINNKYSYLGYGNEGLAIDAKITALNIDNVGGVAGINYGMLHNILAKIDIQANNNVGGAAGFANDYLEDDNEDEEENELNSEYDNRIVYNNSFIRDGITGSNAQFDNVIVELYQDVSKDNYYAKIIGNENVGGLIGYAMGYIEISELVEPDDFDNLQVQIFNLVNVNLILVKNSYVKSYASGSYIQGQNNSAGLVGKAEYTEIAKSYADVNLVVESNNSILAGLVADAKDTQIENAYYIGQLNNLNDYDYTFGTAFGKTNPIDYGAKNRLSMFYSPVQVISQQQNEQNPNLKFVGDADTSNNFEVVQSYGFAGLQYLLTNDTELNVSKTYFAFENGNYVAVAEPNVDDIASYYELVPYSLTDENTYYIANRADKSWKITSQSSNLRNYDWYISGEANDDYPTLVFDSSNLMRKKMATQIYVTPKQNNLVDGYEIISEDLIKLNTNKTYYIKDILNVSVDVNTRTNIYIYSNVESALVTRNLTSKYSSLCSVFSDKEDVITLVFKLGNNPNITKQIQIVFVKEVLDFKVDDVKVRKGDSTSIFASISYELDRNEVNIYQNINNQKYLLGINTTETYDQNIENSNILYYLNITDLQTNIIDGQGLFASNAIVNSKESIVLTNLPIILYSLIDYFDVNNQPQCMYFKVAEYNGFNVSIYSGASSLQITNSNIEMTIIDDVTFTLTMKTDNPNDILYINISSLDIYTNIKKTADNNVCLSQGSIVAELDKNNQTDAKIILSLLASDLKDDELVVTFGLRVNEKYLNSNNTNIQFNQVISTKLGFFAIGAGISGENEVVVETSLDLIVRPQNLLKIDLINYPAGYVENDIYIPSGMFSNTLMPGQVGMIAIDIYPEYAQYDSLEIRATTDNKGNKMSFIQVAKSNIENLDNVVYVDIKPSSVSTEYGILLQKISNIYFKNQNSTNSNYTTNFDGKFYVKTLMGTNVDFDQIIQVSVVGITNIKDENGNIIEKSEIVKTIDIIVNQAPSVNLTYQGDRYSAYVKHIENNKVLNQYGEEENNFEVINSKLDLVTPGQTLNFDIVYKKLALQNIKVNIDIYKYGKNYDGEYTSVVQPYNEILTYNGKIIGNNFAIKINENCAPGTIITIGVEGKDIINDYDEIYESNTIKFVVVDYIITGLSVNNGNNKFVIERPTPVSMALKTISFNSGVQDNIKALESYINTNPDFWYGILPNIADEYENWEQWNLTEKLDDNKGGKLDYSIDGKYDAYSPYARYNGDKIEGLGITAKKQVSDYKKFKVMFYYNYNFADALVVDNEEEINRFVQNGLVISNIITEQCTEAKSVVNMDLKVETDIDNPITISTIEEFYNMKNVTDVDYILANDLYFGLCEEQFAEMQKFNNDSDSPYPEGTYTKNAYTPFDLSVKSFDGNTHKIYIYGNMNIDSSTTTIGLFGQVGAETIVLNLCVEYYPFVTLQQKEDENHEPVFDTFGKPVYDIKENSNALTYENIDSRLVYFGGFAAQNLGIISNCIVKFHGDINISLKENGQVNLAGFVSQNSGKISYSSVIGPDWNDNIDGDIYYEIKTHYQDSNELLTKYNARKTNYNVKLASANAGNMSTFVNSNSNLISNCQSEFIGLENTTSATLGARVAGFVTENASGGKIVGSSVAGQRLLGKYINDFNNLTSEDSFKLFNPEPVKVSDERITILGGDNSIYFARMYSQANIAGFIYQNAGSIQNSYTAIPFETQGRTAGFVYDNADDGSINITYTISLYDGLSQYSSAHTPFVGTNDLGEVLNNPQTSTINFCYYLTYAEEIIEDDETFKEPAIRLSIDIDDEYFESLSDQMFVGFDKGTDKSSVWKNIGYSDYQLPILNANIWNYNQWRYFEKKPVPVISSSGEIATKYERPTEAPSTIANALQFVNLFTDESVVNEDNVAIKDIRLINNIDFTQETDDKTFSEKFEKIRNVIYIGDFDGNGMEIAGIKVSGTSNNVENNSVYSNVSDSFGLFYQIGTATNIESTDENGRIKSTNIDFEGNAKTTIRNLKLIVEEISRSTSTFTGILAGVVINSNIKSVEIDAQGTTVLGRNAVGGLAGAIIGNSKVFDVSVNANVTSTQKRFSNTTYKDREQSQINTYSQIVYDKSFAYKDNGEYKLKENIKEIINRYDAVATEDISEPNQYVYKEDGLIRFDLARQNNEYSYAGGVFGIVDIFDKTHQITTQGAFKYEDNKRIKIVGEWSSNLSLLQVAGDNITITGEVVGGLVGFANKDSFIGSGKFEVSTSDSQRLNGYYTSGGLVGILNGGAIYISTVEVSSSNVESYDRSLTNQTGNNLFSNKNLYPYAIGGIVGLQNGGYILSSYTKTNVINTNVKYAGGVIGYLSNCQDLYYGPIDYNDLSVNADFINEYKQKDELNSNEDDDVIRLLYGAYPMLEEVYSTGNVLASDGYKIIKYGTDDYYYVQVVDSSDGHNSVENIKYAEPLGYAGGIAGGYDDAEYTSIAGVIAMNAFHKPNDYVVSNNDFKKIILSEGEHQVTYLSENQFGSNAVFKLKGELFDTLNVQYSDLMSGYFGAKELSNGTQELMYFAPRIGAMFGQVNGVDGVDFDKAQKVLNYFKNDFSDGQVNLTDRFVYNSATISSNDCKNANGRMIYHIANVGGYLSTGNYELDKIDQYLIYDSSSNKIVYLNTINTQQNIEIVDNVSIEKNSFSYADTYLLFRGQDMNGVRYSKYAQDETGMFHWWSENWRFDNTIYPKLMPNDMGSYILIKNEEELRSIRSGSKYKLIRDIYLTTYWAPKDLFNVTLVSAKRDDGMGISDNLDSGSPYFAIYNINMVDSVGQQYGFFSSLKRSMIKNVNFVFGTKFTNPGNGKKTWKGSDDYLGFNHNNANINQDVGTLVGKMTINSVILNCSVYLVKFSTMHTLTETDHQIVDGTETTSCASYSYTVTNGNDTNAQAVFNFGCFAGSMAQDSYIANSKIMMCNMVESDNVNYHYLKKLYEIDYSENYLDSSFDIRFGENVDDTNPVKNIEFNFGGFIGNALLGNGDETLNNNLSEHIILNINVNRYVERDDGAYNEINIGGFAGIISNHLMSQSKTKDVQIFIQNNVDQLYDSNYAFDLNLGGFVGQINNTALLNCAVEDVNSRGSNTIAIQNADDVVYHYSNASVGGFVGAIKTSAVIEYSDVDIKNLAFEFLVEFRIYLGGFVGQYIGSSGNIIGSSAKFSTISFGEEMQSTYYAYVAGFLGYVNGKNLSISNSYAVGFIDNERFKSIIAGFICQNGGSTASGTNISYCVANVDIDFREPLAENKIYIGGFATFAYQQGDVSSLVMANARGNIKNSVALGNIKLKDSIISTNSYVAGFIMGNNVPNSWTGNYSLTTIKVVRNDNNIYQTSPISLKYSPVIYYNYNLTGVTAHLLDGSNQDNSALLNSVGQDKKYSQLIYGLTNAVVGELTENTTIKGTSITLADLRQGDLGSKLNPYTFNDLTGNKLSKPNAFYCLQYGSDIISNQFENYINNINNDIKGYLIADDSLVATTIAFEKSLNIAEDAFVSGCEITTYKLDQDIDALVSENKGYIFNCVSTGSIIARTNYINLSGFVLTNNGIINSSLSMTYVDANDLIVSTAGFVFENNGIIILCSATNALQHTYLNENNFSIEEVLSNLYEYDGYRNMFTYNNSGFADTNNGTIKRSFAATSMYNGKDDDIDTDSYYIRQWMGSGKSDYIDNLVGSVYVRYGHLNNFSFIRNGNSDPSNSFDLYANNCGIRFIGSYRDNLTNSQGAHIMVQYQLDIIIDKTDFYEGNKRLSKYSTANSDEYDKDYVESSLKSFKTISGDLAINYQTKEAGYDASLSANTRNYGYATPTLFTSTTMRLTTYDETRILDNYYKGATYYTGNTNDFENGYFVKINNYNRYEKTMSLKEKQTSVNRKISLQFVNDINFIKSCAYLFATNYSWLGTDYYNFSKIVIDNAKVFAIDNIVVDTNVINKNIGMFSANSVELNNFGVIGSFKDSDIEYTYTSYQEEDISISLVVSKAEIAKIENSYAILSNSVTIASASYFGLLIGRAEAYSEINSSFASGDIILSNSNLWEDGNNAYVDLTYNEDLPVHNIIVAGVIQGYSKRGIILDSFATGTINLTEDVDASKQQYKYRFKEQNRSGKIVSSYNVGGLVGCIDLCFGIGNNYSNVSILNNIINDGFGKYGDDLSIDALINTNKFALGSHVITIGESLVTISSVASKTSFYSPAISLVSSKFTSNLELATELLVEQFISKKSLSDQSWAYSTVYITRAHHFPIQKVFEKNKIICKYLNIASTNLASRTGSRMSPYAISDEEELLSLDGYSYLTNDIKITNNTNLGYSKSSGSIYGQGYTVSKMYNTTSLYSIFNRLYNCIVSNLNINSIYLANHIRDCYIQNVDIYGSLYSNKGAFADHAISTSFNNCNVDITMSITPIGNNQILGCFTNISSSKTIYKNTSVNAICNVTGGGTGLKSICGISQASYGGFIVCGLTEISLEINESNNGFSSDVLIGGISDNWASEIGIFGKVIIYKIDIIQESSNYNGQIFVGGIFAKAETDESVRQYDLYDLNESTIEIRHISISTNSSDEYQYISGFIAYISAPIRFKNAVFYIYGTGTDCSVIESKNAHQVFAGVLAGYIDYNDVLEYAPSDAMEYIAKTSFNSIYICTGSLIEDVEYKNSSISVEYIGRMKYSNNWDIIFRFIDVREIYAGSLVGLSKAFRTDETNYVYNFRVDALTNYDSFICDCAVGGFIGFAGGNTAILGVELCGDVTLRHYAKFGQAILGGIVGCYGEYDDECFIGRTCLNDDYSKSIMHNGLVAGYSTSSGVTSYSFADQYTNISDARTYGLIGDTDKKGNYSAKTVDMPLIVGGIIGIYNSEWMPITEDTFSNVFKYGSVRALLRTNESCGFISKSMVSNDESVDRKVLCSNNESIRAVAGGMIGYIQSINLSDNKSLNVAGEDARSRIGLKFPGQKDHDLGIVQGSFHGQRLWLANKEELLLSYDCDVSIGAYHTLPARHTYPYTYAGTFNVGGFIRDINFYRLTIGRLNNVIDSSNSIAYGFNYINDLFGDSKRLQYSSTTSGIDANTNEYVFNLYNNSSDFVDLYNDGAYLPAGDTRFLIDCLHDAFVEWNWKTYTNYYDVDTIQSISDHSIAENDGSAITGDLNVFAGYCLEIEDLFDVVYNMSYWLVPCSYKDSNNTLYLGLKITDHWAGECYGAINYNIFKSKVDSIYI